MSHPDRPFYVELKLRIDWSEMDMFAHVNNVMFMKYVQASRVNYWEQCGLSVWYHQDKIGPMLLSTSCHFKKPLFYPGFVLVQARMEYIKQSSFSLHHRLVNDAGEVVAEAADVMVLYDFKTEKKVNVPREIRDAVAEIEQREFE